MTETGETPATQLWEPDSGPVPVGPSTVWATLVGGLVLWAIHLAGLSVLVPIRCDRSATWMWAIHGLTVVTAAGAIGLILSSRRQWRLARDTPGADRTRLLGLAGLFLNTISLLLILGEEVPAIFLEPCR